MRRIHPSTDNSHAELTEEEVLAAYLPEPRDLVRANMVTTVDGASTLRGLSRGISTEADKQLFQVMRACADAVLVGAGTVAQERYRARAADPDVAAARKARGLHEQLTIAIWTPRLSLSADSPIFTESATKPLVLTSPYADPTTLAALDGRAEVITVEGSGPRPVIEALRERGYRSILSEGGPHALAGLLAADVVDELCLTVSPLTVGPGPDRIVAGAPAMLPPTPGTPAADGAAPPPTGWDLAAAYLEESSLFLRYRRTRSRDAGQTPPS